MTPRTSQAEPTGTRPWLSGFSQAVGVSLGRGLSPEDPAVLLPWLLGPPTRLIQESWRPPQEAVASSRECLVFLSLFFGCEGLGALGGLQVPSGQTCGTAPVPQAGLSSPGPIHRDSALPLSRVPLSFQPTNRPKALVLVGWPVSHSTLSLAPVLAWNVGTLQLEVTDGRLLQHGLPVPRAWPPRLPCPSPLPCTSSTHRSSHNPSPSSAWKSS